MAKYQYWADWRGGHMVDTNLKRLGERIYQKFQNMDEINTDALKSRDTQWLHNRRILRLADYKYLARNVFGRNRQLPVVDYEVHIMDFDTPLFGCFEHTITLSRIKI